MADIRSTARRIVSAGAFALALAAVPAVGIYASPSGNPVPRSVAQPAECTGGESMDAYSLACVPDVVPNTGGAPSEEQLTETNPGSASPSRHER
ncbi:hypothetical protein [Mycobacterium sp.]|jgi:hypothetical protein|uniref:hypothetical protein n=1 Tax=Mycobacterium sp. TaxID=1785 RepID=UPI002D656742|nr:hypothetical protein [Mycobacterium sp.]HZA11124.1 hypothetical protein [Mycobacterium sp.]